MAAGDPINDLSDLINLASGTGAPEVTYFHKKGLIAGASPGNTQNAFHSLWLYDGCPAAGAAPSTAAVPTNATNGALKQATSAASTKKRMTSISVGNQTDQNAGGLSALGTFVVYDRLSHQGGLSGTSTSGQTTNLPTAALTRRTTGVGVEAWLEIYTAIGGSGTTVTISYTDDAGNTGNTSPSRAFGGTSLSGQSLLAPIPLAAGDKGVRAVASVTLAGSTGVAGNFGVTLVYPFVALPITFPGILASSSFILKPGGPFDLGATSDACLAFAWLNNNNAGIAPNPFGITYFVEK